MTVFFIVPDDGLRQIGNWLDGHGTPQEYAREIAALPEKVRSMGRFTATPLVDFVRTSAERTAIEKVSSLLVPDDAPCHVRRLLATNGSAAAVLARHDAELDLDILWLGASDLSRAIDAVAKAKDDLPWTAARNADYGRALAYALERVRAAGAALYVDFDGHERGLTHIHNSSSFVVTIDVVSALEVKRRTRAWLASDQTLALHLRTLLTNPVGAKLARSMILDHVARMARALSPFRWQFACAHVVGPSDEVGPSEALRADRAFRCGRSRSPFEIRPRTRERGRGDVRHGDVRRRAQAPRAPRQDLIQCRCSSINRLVPTKLRLMQSCNRSR